MLTRSSVAGRFPIDRIRQILLDSDYGPEDLRFRFPRDIQPGGGAGESRKDMCHADGLARHKSLDDLRSSNSGPARHIRDRCGGPGGQIGLFGTSAEVTEFSRLRASVGYEIMDVVDQFATGYPTVARWETGVEPAPPSVLRALREIEKFTPASLPSLDDPSESTVEAGLAGLENGLLEGDCLKLLRRVPNGSVDLVLCDLPYGTTQNRWDSVIDLDALWAEYKRVLKPNGVVALTAQGIFTAKLILSNEDWFKYKIVWEKSKPTNFLNAKKQPLRKHEDICVFYAKPPTYNPQMRAGVPYDKGVRKNQLSGSYGDFQPAHVRSDGERYPSDIVYFKTAESEPERTVWHPTQKPVELGRYLVRTFSDEGDVVLDNAFGSGSFLVAAAMENRRFIGIERNEEVHLFKNERIDYVALAAERLKRVGTAPSVVRR